MPWVSKAQAKWGNSPAGHAALGGDSAVAEWNNATNFSTLPDKKPKTVPRLRARHIGGLGKIN